MKRKLGKLSQKLAKVLSVGWEVEHRRILELMKQHLFRFLWVKYMERVIGGRYDNYFPKYLPTPPLRQLSCCTLFFKIFMSISKLCPTVSFLSTWTVPNML
jgi:hypothetical protein